MIDLIRGPFELLQHQSDTDADDEADDDETSNKSQSK